MLRDPAFFWRPNNTASRGRGEGRIGRLRSLEKMPPKNAIFWTVLSKIVALARERKPYRIGLLFTHKNSDFSAISVTARSCTALISKMEHHILDKFGAIFKYSVNLYLDRTGSEYTGARTGIHWEGRKYSGVRSQPLRHNVKSMSTTSSSSVLIPFRVGTKRYRYSVNLSLEYQVWDLVSSLCYLAFSICSVCILLLGCEEALRPCSLMWQTNEF